MTPNMYRRNPSQPRLYLLPFFVLLSLVTHGQEWKARATADIETHRMAPLTVTVVGADGAPLPGASVQIRQRESEFRWGTTVNIARTLDLEQRGVVTGGDHPYYNHLLHFNSVTPENAGKWKGWLRTDSRNKYLDVMDWLTENDVANRGHGTIWPSIDRWNAVPDTILNATAETDANGTVIRTKNEVIRAIVRGHIEDNMATLGAKGIYEQDLVNELIHEADITTNLMGLNRNQRVSEHTQWYQWAKAAAPNVDLVANEFDLFQNGNNFHETFVRYVNDMIAEGAPVDRVGMQGHFFGTMPAFSELKKRLDEVAVLGLPMAVTEFDMAGSSYADAERALYSVFSHPDTYGFTLWGAWDGQQWRGNAVIFDDDWTIKPSGRAYFDLVKTRWRTDTTLATAENGTLTLNAFKGTYDVFVEVDGRVTAVAPVVTGDGTAITVTVATGDYALPTATLEAEGAPDTIYPNQPVTYAVNTEAEIERVVYYDGLDIVKNAREAPFNAVYVSGRAGATVAPRAEVHFANGYRATLEAAAYVIDDGNQAPVIGEQFPENGSQVLIQDSISLRFTARDAPEDTLTATLLDGDGNEIARTVGSPFLFRLPALSSGPRQFTLRVADNRFAVSTKAVTLNFVGGASSTTESSPVMANDDIEEKADGGIDVEGDLDLGEKLTAIRFPKVGIPLGAKITSASIQFGSQKSDQGDAMSVEIYGEKANDPPPPNVGRWQPFQPPTYGRPGELGRRTRLARRG